MLISLFVSSAYPDFAYWTISGEAVFMIMLGGINVFFGPLVGTLILLLLNDFVTRLTEHYSLVLGIIILCSRSGCGTDCWAWCSMRGTGMCRWPVSAPSRAARRRRRYDCPTAGAEVTPC